MERPSALMLGCLLLLWTGGTASANTSSSIAPPVRSDTIYVADADPVVVVYEKQLDTLVVRAEDEAGAPIAAAEESEPDLAVETEPTPSGDRPTSTTETSTTETPSKTSPTPTTARKQAASSLGNGSAGVKEGISVAGLVIDRTHSVIGRDFQDAFNDHWEEPEDVSSFTIRIDEQPLPQFGSKIQVSVEGKTLFQAQLRPEYQRIQKAARQAAARTRYYLQEFYEPREVY